MSHANRGLDWERTCEQSFKLLAARGRLAWWRPSVPFVLLSEEGKGVFRGRRTGDGPPDFYATAGLDPSASHPGLIAIVGDMKEGTSRSWALSNLAPHQADAFDAHERQLGTAIVLLRMLEPGKGPAYFVLPWRLLGPAWKTWHAGKAKRGEASLTREQALRVGFAYDGIDWLTPLRRYLGGALHPQEVPR